MTAFMDMLVLDSRLPLFQGGGNKRGIPPPLAQTIMAATGKSA